MTKKQFLKWLAIAAYLFFLITQYQITIVLTAIAVISTIFCFLAVSLGLIILHVLSNKQ